MNLVVFYMIVFEMHAYNIVLHKISFEKYNCIMGGGT